VSEPDPKSMNKIHGFCVMERCPLCGKSYDGHKGIFINESLRDIVIDGKYINLTPRELQVFAGIVKGASRLVSKAYLMDYIYGLETDNEPHQKVIDVFIYKLRKKIKCTRFEIENVPCVGYRLKERDNGSEKQAN